MPNEVHLTAVDLVIVGVEPRPAKPVKQNDGLLSLDEASQYLSVTADQATGFVQDGELRYINVGRGKKRPRMRFDLADLNEFIERRRRRDIAACQSIDRKSQHRIIGSTSKSEVIGFTALRAAQIARMPRRSKP
jgi:excisionase family DNA binding protein